MGRAERQALLRDIERARGSKVIAYITSDRENASAGIGKDAVPVLFEQLRHVGRAEKIDLIISTNGGDTLAGFGIARLAREFGTRIGVLVPMRCHSAGTLIALGANEIVMTSGATLSPIDPSIVGPLNPAVELAPGQRQLIPLSVESVAGFRKLVVNEWDIKGEDALSAAFKLLAEKVHPLALGDVFRAREQIATLARKLMFEHRDRAEEDKVTAAVNVLTRELGSHDYPISRKEARQILGEQVVSADATLEDLLLRLFQDHSTEMELNQPFVPVVALNAARARGVAGPVQFKQTMIVVESASMGIAAERELLLREIALLPPGVPPQLAQAPGTPREVRPDVVRAEWRRYA